MKRFNCYFGLIALSLLFNPAYGQPDVNKECEKMVQYALIKHGEYGNGRSIESLLEEEEKSGDSEKQKFYKMLVIEILDTFAVWDDPVEKNRIHKEINDHFMAICDPNKIKNVFDE